MKMIVLTCWQFENRCVWHKPHRTNNVCSWSPMDLWPKHKKYKHGRYERRVPKPSVFNTCLKSTSDTWTFLLRSLFCSGRATQNELLSDKSGTCFSPRTDVYLFHSKDFESELYQGKAYISAATDDEKPSRALSDQEIPALKTETLRWSNHTGALPRDPSSKTFSCSISLGPNKHSVLKNLKGYRLNLRSLW